MPNDPFIDAAALSTLGGLRYLDARDQAAFDAGHPAGAKRVPADAWDKAIKSADNGLDNAAFWRDEFAALGVSPAVTTVTYDGGGMTNAARVWFVLQYFGLPSVMVNGGWSALAAASPPPANAHAGNAPHLAPGRGAVGLVVRHTLKQQLGGQAQVLDNRTHAEFTGDDSRNRARSGHLPGARHLSHADLMQAGVVHAAPRLRQMLEAAGFDESDRIVTHCEGGGRAALAAAAAVRAGYGDVRVYYHSFSDWVRDESCPVVRA